MSQYSITFYASHSLEEPPPWMVKTIIVDGNTLLGDAMKKFNYDFVYPVQGTYIVQDTPVALLYREVVLVEARHQEDDEENGYLECALIVGQVM